MKPCYFTTRQFAHRDRIYRKHCGPTAMTNLICTLRPELASAPAQVFDEVARIGRRSGLYWNLPVTKHIGGTNDVLAAYYLRRVLDHFALQAVRVHMGGPATAARLRAALAKGHICYLELHGHKKYHNHHLLVYASDWQGFCAADGWLAQPVYLHERDLRCALFISVEAQTE